MIIFFAYLMINIAATTASYESWPSDFGDAASAVLYAERHGHRYMIKLNSDEIINGNYSIMKDSYAAIAAHRGNGFAFSAIYPDDMATDGEAVFMHKGPTQVVVEGDYFLLVEDFHRLKKTPMTQIKSGKCPSSIATGNKQYEPYHLTENGENYYPAMYLANPNNQSEQKILGTFIGDIGKMDGHIYTVLHHSTKVGSAGLKPERIEIFCREYHYDTWQNARI